jgi:hypothetical protein
MASTNYLNSFLRLSSQAACSFKFSSQAYVLALDATSHNAYVATSHNAARRLFMAITASARARKSRKNRERRSISPDVSETDRSEGERQVAIWLLPNVMVSLWALQ